MVAAQILQPVGEIDVVAAEAAFADQYGDLGRVERGTERGGIDHHAREPRRQRQQPQFLPFAGDAAVAVDGAEFGEQGFRFRQRRAWRRVEESELLRRAAPGRKIEREGRQVG